MINLIKKDILTIKKHIPVIVFISIAIPLILAYSKINGSFLTVMLTVMYTEFFTIMYIFAKDYQCPKATALIASTPYSRDQIVAARYLLIIMLFLISLLVVFAESLIIPVINVMGFGDISAVFITMAVILGIFMPFIYRFGYEKTRYLYMVFIICIPLITNLLTSAVSKSFIDMIFHSEILSSILMLLIGILALYISYTISKKVFSKKEL